jgi:hypothetical protein
MTKVIKYLLINFGMVLSVSIFLSFSMGMGENIFLGWNGAIAILAAVGNAVIGLTQLISRRKDRALALLISAGVLLLLGLSICSSTRVI